MRSLLDSNVQKVAIVLKLYHKMQDKKLYLRLTNEAIHIGWIPRNEWYIYRIERKASIGSDMQKSP